MDEQEIKQYIKDHSDLTLTGPFPDPERDGRDYWLAALVMEGEVIRTEKIYFG